MSRRLRWLARVGYATKGCVYLLMGTLAVLAASGQRGGRVGDKRESVHALQALPGGRVLLGLIAVGLSGYALMRIAQGILDTEAKGRDAKGLLRRFGFVVNGLIYGGLIAYAADGALHGGRGPSARQSEQSWAARILAWPGGTWVLLLTGGVIVVAGLYTLSQVWTGRFLEAIELEALGDKRRAFAHRAGQIGYGARGIVMLIVGAFFLHAGKTARATDVGSTADALDLFWRIGPGVLGVVAFGLAAYGAYAILQAVYPVRR